MKLPAPLHPATVHRRLNRFAVEVTIDGAPQAVHLANSSRPRELLVPGTPALLAPRQGVHRKTGYDLLLVRVDGQWVSADARLPNALLREALLDGRLAPFSRYPQLAAEVSYGGSRVDFALANGAGGLCLVEAKSVTLVADPAFGRALRQAAAVGVSILAYRCCVTPREVRLTEPVAVRL
ncbi:MAG: DNA/RNA nuclease SfsA [Dehalococcoidia bacterium]